MAFPAVFLPKKLSPKGIVALIIFIILLILVAPGYYFYIQYQDTQKLLENPADSAKEEVAAVVAKVAGLILLPKDEEPTLATVSDKTKLANQAFFAHAQNGDKVLIYTKSKKAYLYRPSIDKIIDVAPVNIGEQAPPQQPVNIAGTTTPSAKVSPTSTPIPTSTFQKVNVALYNGTKTAGLAATTETTLKTKAPFVTVAAKGNATNNYTETVVIDFTGKYKKEAAELVKILGGAVGVLPKGETKPTADILVILGPQ